MYNKNSMTRAVQSSDLNKVQIEGLLRLFKIAPSSFKTTDGDTISAYGTLRRGILFVDSDGVVSDSVPREIATMAYGIYSNSGDFFNQTFYKSFSTVRDIPTHQLIFDQILHYLSTYGAEAMGVSVPTYIPVQALEIPEVNSDAKITIIQLLSQEECIGRFCDYLTTLTAPKEQNLRWIEMLLPLAKDLDTGRVKSFEVQVMKHTLENTVPSHPQNQLRYLIYRLTGETLLIKNRTMRMAIKYSASSKGTLAKDILTRCNPTSLASIFFRFKPLFLALKVHSGCAPIINAIRRHADKFHQPLSNESLQNFTSITNPAVRDEILEHASNRELVKLINSLFSRTGAKRDTPAIFSIRNGRTFVKEGGLYSDNAKADGLKDEVVEIIEILTNRLKPVVGGKTFYIPSYIDYAAPTTEKQFTGNIPWGSAIAVGEGKAITLGIHWFNTNSSQSYGSGRVDIDLHLKSTTRQFGWNSAYRDGGDILYTGDQTNAPHPKGAAEAYWVQPKDEVFIISAHLYSGDEDAEFKIFMSREKPSTKGRDYIYDPNNAAFTPIPMKFNSHNSAMPLGILMDGGFYFYGSSVDRGIIPEANYESFIKGLQHQLRNKASLRGLLSASGAKVLDSLEELTTEELEGVISLAPEDLNTDTLINIIDGKID